MLELDEQAVPFLFATVPISSRSAPLYPRSLLYRARRRRDNIRCRQTRFDHLKPLLAYEEHTHHDEPASHKCGDLKFCYLYFRSNFFVVYQYCRRHSFVALYPFSRNIHPTIPKLPPVVILTPKFF